jgi:glycogen synthase
MQDHSSGDRVNPVKGAIIFSNIVTTVSPTYAQEVRTAEVEEFPLVTFQC